MIKRTEERLGLKPERLAADTAYGTGKFLHWVIGSGITPHIPVWDMSKREDGILSRADFTFDSERNLGTPEFAKSRNERKKVEMRFAHVKTHHGFERMRLRGLSGARDEFHLAAIVQNLKTLANHIWRPRLNTPAACVA
jgi:hypothetical protein